MNMLKRTMAMLMVLCMLVSAVPMMALAAETDATEPAVELTNQTATVADTGFYRILHLDCGRKYFTKDWIIALINEMSAAGYTHLELAFGNDGLRFLLDDMSVGSYTDAQVTAAVQQGNRNYHDFGTNELTEAEMNAIIAHANRMGIKILPLLNNPGHMNAIVSASSTLTGSSAGFDGSATTVDLENTAAVNFTKGLVEKYIAYFSSKGCTEFNFGADEYANDRYSGGSMGFGALVNQGKYQLFVNYVNEMAALIKGYNMTPIVFNDGIYFNNATSYNFDKDITVAFWTSGWYGYQSASASRMAELGHEMINVNGDYYYVTGKDDRWTSGSGNTTHNPSLYTEASNWTNSGFMGSTVANPAGGMFCIWCDYPDFETETQIAANIRLVLRAMAAEMQGQDATSISTEVVSGGFNVDGTIAETRNWVENIPAGDAGTVAGYELTRAETTAVSASQISGLTGADRVAAWDITAYVGDEEYTDRGEVSLTVPAGWNTDRVTGFYVENGTAVKVVGTYADGKYTFAVPTFTVVGLVEITHDKLVELRIGETYSELLSGVDLSGQTFTPTPAGIASVGIEVSIADAPKKLVKVNTLSDIVSGEQYVLVNTRSGKYLNNVVTTRSGKNILTQAQDSAQNKYSVNSTAWVITRNGNNFYIYNNGYITIPETDAADLTTTQTALTIHDYGDATFAIGQSGQYLNDTAAQGQHAGGYWVLNDGGAHWQLYRVSNEAVTLERVNTLSDFISGERYVIENTRSGNALGDTTGNAATWGTTCIVQVSGAANVNSAPWTITFEGANYQFANSAGKYMTIGSNTSNLYSSVTNLSVHDYGDGTFAIGQSNQYLNDMGNEGGYAGGYWDRDDGGAHWRFYRLVDHRVSDGTTVTFTGESSGEAYVTINNVIYKIIVHGQVPITIHYVDENGNEIKSEEVMVNDNATTYELANFNHGDKFYMVENSTLAIDPANITSYTVTVIETEEDLDAVPSVTIEYWQTNAHVRDGDDATNISREVAARDAYSEDGVDVTSLTPADPHKHDAGEGDPDLGFWWAKLLERATHEQTENNGDDETMNGVVFTRIRYWNGLWAVYTDDGEWTEIAAENLGEYQFVFYFMNDMHLADEVMIGTSDWGKLGDGTYGNQYLGRDHVSLAFQVVYEDGTTSPETTTADDLASVTYLVDRWDPARGIGSMSINEIADYQIWKVTAETGTHTTTWAHMSPTYITNFTWDDNEMTVWEGDPVSSYTIVNSAKNPSKEGAYANLTWDEQNESILIRIYIKAVETEDSLTVVYCDETFGDTLYTYNVLVPGDTNFTDDIEGETVFAGNDQRIDVSGAYIVNNQNKPQYFQTDLSGVPQIVGKYNSNLYTYTGSEISEDGKTLYLYYNFDESALPVYVADFGLPLTFSLIELTQAEVSSVTVTEQTRYGRLSYRSDPKNIGGIFIYQPTSILQGADMLTINITFADGSTSTSNIMVLPATSVYYEEGFIFNENSTGWENTDNKGQYMQYTEAIGRKVNNYGYDDVYTDTPGASCESNATASQIGAKTTFTFTGNGIQIFANATEESGYVAVEIKDSTGKVVNVSMVDTVVKGGETDATEGQEGNLYGLPIVSLVDLQNMRPGTYTVKLTKIMNDKPVYIDGIRVFNTMADSSAYAEDLEDNPEFYELRDYVLNAVQIDDETSKDYGTLAEMANQVYAGISTDTEAPVAMVTTGIGDVYGDGATAQDLLDNGPKNELYLYPGQTLSFKVTTARVMQIGLKAPSGSTSARITVDGTEGTQRITSSVDMFYSLTTQPGTEQEHLISITNAGENILSVTLLKVCDDPDFAFGALTEQDVEKLLQASFRASGESPVLTGDVDGDWDVDAADLTLVARHVGGIELLSDEMLKNADVDGDGIVNARDLTIHARFTGGIILRWKDDADQTA